jgi:hypothetical protein
MANGATVALLPPASGPAPAQAKPAAPPAATAIQIGSAVADAVEALIVALIDTESGAPLRPETKALNGEKIAQVVELQLDALGEVDDFRNLALAAGRSAILERHGEALHRLLGAGVPETAIVECIDELCGHIITVATEVAAVEAVYRSH